MLAVVHDRPGATASELAAASGVTAGTLYALLRRLTEQGELAKQELPGGQTGYALAADDASMTVGVRDAEAEQSSQARAVEDPAASDRQTVPLAASPPDAEK